MVYSKDSRDRILGVMANDGLDAAWPISRAVNLGVKRVQELLRDMEHKGIVTRRHGRGPVPDRWTAAGEADKIDRESLDWTILVCAVSEPSEWSVSAIMTDLADNSPPPTEGEIRDACARLGCLGLIRWSSIREGGYIEHVMISTERGDAAVKGSGLALPD